MDHYEPYASLGLALAIGLLIGFEREQSAPTDPARTFQGGARTFPLVALAGALASLFTPVLGVAPLLVGLLALFSLLVASYWEDVRQGRDRGLTTEVAFLVTYLLGALSTAHGVIEPDSKRAIVLLSVAVLVTLILSLKPSIHALAHKATRDDVLAGLKFLIVAVVVLPLLPSEPVGPFGGIVPARVGLMVMLVAAVGFVGYLAVRLLGPGRGLGATGLLGGLVSSTAVTLSLSGRARGAPALAAACALAVLSASAVMPVRMVAVAAVVHPPLALQLAGPLLAAALAGAGVCLLLYRRSRSAPAVGEGLAVQNPFELSSALKFGLIYIGVVYGARLGEAWLGHRGVYLAALVAGLADVDAILLTLTSQVHDGALAAPVATLAITLAAASNTLVKAGLALGLGGLDFGKRVLPGYLAMALAGAAGLVAYWSLGHGG